MQIWELTDDLFSKLSDEVSITPFFSDKMLLIKFSNYYCHQANFVEKITEVFLKNFFKFYIIPYHTLSLSKNFNSSELQNIYNDLFYVLNELLQNASRGRIEKQGSLCMNKKTCTRCNEVSLSLLEDHHTIKFSISNVDFPTPRSYEKITNLICNDFQITEIPLDPTSTTGGGGLGIVTAKKLLQNYNAILSFNITQKYTEFSFDMNKSFFGIPLLIDNESESIFQNIDIF